ncbi:DUF1775 domain-containing protein [Actinoplanes sp. NPDC051343]|uniref:DUF1775 domain-containing protein n=1 Tax=Actinoplanes sp. NPDC051343 TaxID=3363906 RepID=UPI0037A0EB33
MRELVLARRAGVLAVAAVAGALVATPALADVAVTPTSAVQGDAVDVNFKVTNTGDKPLGTVTVTLPADAPVAEAYPLSNDDWAPKITTKKLTHALPSMMTDIPVDQATSAITWIAMPGLALAPGRTADLKVSLGPMPTLSSYKFTVTTKYSDGTAGPAMTPGMLTLSPATAQQQAVIDQAHAGMAMGGQDATSAGDPNADENAQFAKVVADATRGPSVLSIVGWIVAGAALLGGVWLMFRSRHRAEEDDEPSDEEDVTPAAPSPTASADEADQDVEAREPVAAGKWSLKEE